MIASRLARAAVVGVGATAVMDLTMRMPGDSQAQWFSSSRRIRVEGRTSSHVWAGKKVADRRL